MEKHTQESLNRLKEICDTYNISYADALLFLELFEEMTDEEIIYYYSRPNPNMN